jgi:hypothetical protein
MSCRKRAYQVIGRRHDYTVLVQYCRDLDRLKPGDYSSASTLFDFVHNDALHQR